METEKNENLINKTRLLSYEAMEKIHQEALGILETIGIEVDHQVALEMLHESGAVVDFETKVVKFPADLVEKCLEIAPRQITLGARNPDHTLLLEPFGKMYSRNTGGMAHIRDFYTGEVREVTLKDVADYARLIDGLEDISFLAPIYAEDVPGETRELQVLKAMFNNTGKHVNIRALERRALPYLARAGQIVAGGEEEFRKRPVISILEAPIAPLKFPDVFVETLYTSGKYGIPVEICSMPNIGATGPITLAGSLLLTVVEHMATFVIGELAYPGNPIIWAPRYPMMDMATGFTGVLVEGGIVSAAAAQMITEYYGMVCDLHGPATNAVISNGESVMEGTFAGFITALAGGPAVLCGAGALEIGLVASFEELVIDNEVFALVRRVLQGFEVSEDTLGVEAFGRVGIGGDFLRDPHTIKHLRSERYFSKLLKPKVRDSWAMEGSKTLLDSVRERVEKLLTEHHPEQLDPDTQKLLDELIDEASRELATV